MRLRRAVVAAAPRLAPATTPAIDAPVTSRIPPTIRKAKRMCAPTSENSAEATAVLELAERAAAVADT